MAHRVKKAVVPAAGLGTRFLPATKALPKEMLPVVDTPAIQYVVEEAVNAGLTDLLMVTGRNKNALENHFDRNYELESTLEAKNDEDRLLKVTHSTDLADIHYVRQGDPKGLGHAVSRAVHHIGDEPFALLLGDDIIDPAENLLERMLGHRSGMIGFPLRLLARENYDRVVKRRGARAVAPVSTARTARTERRARTVTSTPAAAPMKAVPSSTAAASTGSMLGRPVASCSAGAA